MKKTNTKNKNFPLPEVEKILKKQKILFALWNASSKKDSHYQNYYLPLIELFEKAILFDPRKERFNHGSKQMNELFFSLIEKEKPNYIFLIIGRDELTIETMQKIKKFSPKSKIISFVGDDDTQFETLKRYQGLFADCNFLMQPDYVQKYYKDGIKNIYPTNGLANTELFKPIRTKKIYDVTFIGQPSKPRLEVIRFLIDNKVNLKIFGRGWENYPEFKDFYLGSLETEDMVKVVNQSKINLALTRNAEGGFQIKGKLFEYSACKSFSLIDHFEEYLKLFKEGKEIITFKNENDLLEKIKYYLENEKEREKIAENTYKKTIKNHSILTTYKEMFKEMMENEEIFSSKIPQISKRIITLKKEDLHKNNKQIKKLVEGFDYISFSDGESLPLNNKDYLQSYSLEKTKKDISCCDYYIHDKILGNYLLVNIYEASLYFGKDKFDQLMSINQIAVSKEFFINNINRFKEFINGKRIDIVNNKNTCFVSIPLIKNKRINKLDYDVFSYAFQKIFIIKIYYLLKLKKLVGSSYFYRLIYLLTKNPFLVRYLIDSIKDKRNWNQLKI